MKQLRVFGQGRKLEKLIWAHNTCHRQRGRLMVHDRCHRQRGWKRVHVKEKYGHIDITASFAGGSAGRVCKEFKPFHELSIDAINWGVDVNLKAPMYLARAVLPIMLEQKSGVIINIGSITGVSAAHDAEYSAAKSGLIGFTKSIAIIGAPHGVRCCLVSPGGVMTRPGMAGFKCPMNRVAEPEEIINVVLFVSSDKASFVTGDNYLVDGGRACGAMA